MYIQGTEDNSYKWVAFLCVYTGVWRYLTEYSQEEQPTFFIYNVLTGCLRKIV